MIGTLKKFEKLMTIVKKWDLTKIFEIKTIQDEFKTLHKQKLSELYRYVIFCFIKEGQLKKCLVPY